MHNSFYIMERFEGKLRLSRVTVQVIGSTGSIDWEGAAGVQSNVSFVAFRPEMVVIFPPKRRLD